MTIGKKLFAATLAGAAILSSTVTIAQQEEEQREYPTAIPLFEEACFNAAYDLEALAAAADADEEWTADERVIVDVEALEISRAISRNYRFKNPANVRQWSRQVEGRYIRLVMATFDDDQRYEEICAIVFPNVENVRHYSSEFRDLMREQSIRGKSTDLPHYFEFASRIGEGDERNRVRAEIFSRTQSLGRGQNAMHLYIAF